MRTGNADRDGGHQFFFGLGLLDCPGALQHVLTFRGDFGTWAVRNVEELFLPKRENNYSLNAIIYAMMERLHQDYEVLMRMPDEDRDELFALLEESVKRENEQSKKK